MRTIISSAAAGQKAVPAKPPETPVSVADGAIKTAGIGKGIGKANSVISTLPIPQPLPAIGGQGGPSKPAWLLLVGGGLAALYYYLEEGKRGRKK